MVERSLEQKVCDRLLLLWLIRKSSSLDAYKLQKLPFRVDYELNKEGKRVFNYEFFQYDQGPFSVEIYDDRDFLQEESLISVEGYTAKITPKGEKFLSDFDSIFEENSAIIKKLSEYAERFSHMSSYNLVEDTRQMKHVWKGKPTRVGDLPKYATILAKPRRSSLKVDSSTLETIIIHFHSELLDNLRKARKEGTTSSPYKPLIST